jgi:Tol biopolymer transport system component
MSGRFDVDRQVTSWLQGERPEAAPDGLFDAILAELDRTPRRPGWRIADRWTWRHGAALHSVARVALLVALFGALLLTAVWLALFVGSRRPAPPFGLTRAGLIAFDTAEGIVVQAADGRDRHLLVAAVGQSISPTFSRDGLRLAYWHRSDGAGPWSLVVVDADGSDPVVVADGVRLREREDSLGQPSNIAWSPDSRRIAFAADVGPGHSVFVATFGQLAPVRITDPDLKAFDPAWRPDGSLIAFQSEADETVHVVAPDGSGERRLAALQHTFLWPDWSPDGRSLATMAFVPDASSADTGQTEIFTISSDGQAITNVSRDPADDYSPAWSPDGSRLAWDRVPSDASVRAYLVVAQASGPNVTEIRIDADLAPPTWSPDGTRIYSYVMGADAAFHEIVVVDPNGVAPVVRLPAEGNTGNGNWQRLP